MSAIRTSSRAGFTLLELIVALAITAMLAASLFSALFVAFRAKESAERQVAPIRTAELAMEMIRVDLQAAQPPHGILAKPFVGTASQDSRGNESDTLQLSSNADVPQHVSGIGDIKQVVLLVKTPEGSNDHVLVRQVTGNLLAPQVMQPDEEVICRHVWSFKLRYYDGFEWQDSWDSAQEQNTLPAAIEVTLEIKPPEAPANALPIHLRRVLPLACVTSSDTGQDGSAGAGSGGGAAAGGGGAAGGGPGGGPGGPGNGPPPNAGGPGGPR